MSTLVGLVGGFGSPGFFSGFQVLNGSPAQFGCALSSVLQLASSDIIL
jgi:hypothetical protein